MTRKFSAVVLSLLFAMACKSISERPQVSALAADGDEETVSSAVLDNPAFRFAEVERPLIAHLARASALRLTETGTSDPILFSLKSRPNKANRSCGFNLGESSKPSNSLIPSL